MECRPFSSQACYTASRGELHEFRLSSLDRDEYACVSTVGAERDVTLPCPPLPPFPLCCSGSMVLVNKYALASFDFNAPTGLLFFQCALCVVLLKFCDVLGFVKLQPLKRDLVLTWLPVNLLFVGMIGSSFYALRDVGVGMVTVWKNLR